MVTFGSLSSTSTEWRKYSKRLYAETLEAETGLSTGFKGCGFVELATDGDRLEEYRRVAAFNRKEGVDVQEISAAEVERLFPLCRVDDVLAGFYVADDGRVNPVDATAALAKGFKNMGGTVVECACVVELKFLDARGAFDKKGHGDVPIWAMMSEDILTLDGLADASIPTDGYVDDGEAH